MWTAGVGPDCSVTSRAHRRVGTVAYRLGKVAGLVVLSLVILAWPVSAAPPAQTPTEAPTGIIVGEVHNYTTGRAVGGVPVRLRRWRMEAELSPLTSSADSGGQFRFDGLDASAHAFYQAETDYQGITFHTGFVAFESGITQTAASVGVFETTDRPDDIAVQRFHFIIMAPERGVLSVLELYQFGNRGNRAYVGRLNGDGQRETVHMALPPGAQDLALQSGVLGVDVLSRPDEIIATAPVLPGSETFDLAFLYLVPYDAPSVILDRRLHYDTVAVNGLLMDVGAEMQSDVLEFAGERAAQGQDFLQFTGQHLRAGQVLPITLSRLDNIRFVTAPDAGGEAAAQSSAGLNQTVLLWVMLGLGAVVIASGAIYPALRTRPGATALEQGSPETERQRLLLILARLDEAHAAGQLSETVYHRARAHRKVELSRLWRAQDQP